MTTILDHAIQYTRRGSSVIPVPHRSKNPGIEGWQHLRLGIDDLPRYFNCKPQNIGVLLGVPSSGLADVDLDHPLALAIADELLPPTPGVFGRASKPRSHRIYRVIGDLDTHKFRSKTQGMIVELRSTGCQTVFPPSTHESGEEITWEVPDAEPAEVDADVLLHAVEQIAARVRTELGESVQPPPASEHAADSKPEERVQRCLAEMKRMGIVDKQDGSHRLFCAACRVVEHDLDDHQAIECIRAYEKEHPFPRQWSDKEIFDRIRDAEKRCQRGQAPQPTSKPEIIIGTDEHRVIDEAVAALSQDHDIYARGGILVRVQKDDGTRDTLRRTGRSLLIKQLPVANLRERLTRVADFMKYNKKGDLQPAHPPSWLVRGVDARGTWDVLRSLVGISEVPILRPDGSVCQQPGYDADTRVLYAPTVDIPQIAPDVDIDDATAALDLLLEAICDFNFESADHRAAWVAGLLTPIARHAFEGSAPLFLIDANVRGAGKGLLGKIIGQIVSGKEMPACGYTQDREEMRKLITSIALAGDPIVMFDNLEGTFGNDALDRALTTTCWKDRILGKSETADLPLFTTWYATGNNVQVGADTTRRLLHIRLDVLHEHPEDRSGFRHPHLIKWLAENRIRLLSAALTILAAYYRSGRPSQGLTPFGSFEGWSELVREAVVWVGLPDPCNTRIRLADSADTVADVLTQLMEALRQYDPSNEGIVIADLLGALYPRARETAPTDEASNAMRAALENLVNCASGKVPAPRQVGNRLRHFRRRVISHSYLDIDVSQHRRAGALWRLFEAKEGA